MAAINEILGSLKEDASVRDLRICLRAAAVWSSRLGLAYSFPRIRCCQDGEDSDQPGRLLEKSARQLADLALSRDLLDASVGLAAVNSLIDPEPNRLVEGNAYELIASRGAGKDMTVVGHFPFVERLRKEVRNLWVLEIQPREGHLPAEEADRFLPRSDVVVITGSTLINHTFDRLVELARGSYVVVLGPSTPLTSVLIDHGVSAVCGSLVEDPETVLQCVSHGSSFRNTKGLKPVIMSVDDL